VFFGKKFAKKVEKKYKKDIRTIKTPTALKKRDPFMNGIPRKEDFEKHQADFNKILRRSFDSSV